MPELKKQEQQDQEKFFNEETDFAEKMSKWDDDIMGDSPDTYRANPPKSHQSLFLENMGDRFDKLGKSGITSAQFQAETDRKQRNREVTMKELDIVQFYREMEEALKITNIPRKNAPGFFESIWRRMKGNKFVKVQEYQENSQKYHEIQERICQLNGNIETLRSQLADRLDVDLLVSKGTPDEKKARADITRQQAEIQHLINMVTESKREQIKTQELKSKVWTAVERELRDESEKLKNKFGNRVHLLISDRQELISEFRNLNNDQQEQIKRKYELYEEINKIDTKLEKIKKEMIKYKAERPVFLFERIYGVISIPEIYRYGQESSETLKRTWENAANRDLQGSPDTAKEENPDKQLEFNFKAPSSKPITAEGKNYASAAGEIDPAK